MSLDWEHGKIVELDDGTWWTAVHYRESVGAEWKHIWRNVVTYARYEPNDNFVNRLGTVRGFAKVDIPERAFHSGGGLKT